jgi:hypothetical protein
MALTSAPDIAVFWFGGNDAKPLVIHDVEGIPKIVLENEVLPKIAMIAMIAAHTNSVIINYHDAFISHPEFFPDGVHPNDAGRAAIGKFVADIITSALNTPTDAGAGDRGCGRCTGGSSGRNSHRHGRR